MSIYLFKHNKKISTEETIAAEYFSRDRFNIFESVRTYHGVPFRLADHLKRLGESAKTAGFQLPTEPEHIEKELYYCLGQVPKGEYFIRITVVEDGVLILFVPGKEYPDSIYKEGVRVSTVPTIRNPVNASYPPVKGSNFINQVMGTLDPIGHDTFEIIFKSQDGMLQEARTWNFFIVKDGVLKTPPVVGLLGGVTRSFVIELALALGIPVSETSLTRHEAYNADEAFLTNSSGEIVPIREWDGRKIGEAVPGEITKKLHQEYKKRTRLVRHKTSADPS